MRRGQCLRATLWAGSVVAVLFAGSAAAAPVTITVENLAPSNGNYFTPVWVGFHDGSFDTFDVGASASMGVERLAEDGNAGPLSSSFLGSGAGTVDGVVPGPGGPYAPGDVSSMTFDLDFSDPESRYLSFASMIIPSNDAFIGNDDATAYEIIGADGTFLGASFFITGQQVLDAGTEVNSEAPSDTAFFGQMMADTGMDQGGVIAQHGGFMRPGSGGILDDPMFANADFTAAGYPIAQIRVTPEPATGLLRAIGAGAMMRRRRRKADC